MRAVHVVGGGPGGVMAAFAAMREGAGVRIFEKSAFPRHKVCGEFLSPAILPLLRRAGCEAGFLQLRPTVLSAMRLHFGTRVIRHPLPEPAYGVSRYELDRLLLPAQAKGPPRSLPCQGRGTNLPARTPQALSSLLPRCVALHRPLDRHSDEAPRPAPPFGQHLAVTAKLVPPVVTNSLHYIQPITA
jgi:hypothetical protein